MDLKCFSRYKNLHPKLNNESNFSLLKVFIMSKKLATCTHTNYNYK